MGKLLKGLWELFVNTGLPEAYMAYHSAAQEEEAGHGTENDGHRAESHGGGRE